MHKTQRITLHNNDAWQTEKQVFGIFQSRTIKYTLLH